MSVDNHAAGQLSSRQVLAYIRRDWRTTSNPW